MVSWRDRDSLIPNTTRFSLVSKSAKDPGPGRMFERRTWGGDLSLPKAVALDWQGQQEQHPRSVNLVTLREICKYDLQELWEQYYTSTPFPVSETPNTLNKKIACRLVKYLLLRRSAGLDFDDNECVKPYDLSPFIVTQVEVPWNELHFKTQRCSF